MVNRLVPFISFYICSLCIIMLPISQSFEWVEATPSNSPVLQTRNVAGGSISCLTLSPSSGLLNCGCHDRNGVRESFQTQLALQTFGIAENEHTERASLRSSQTVFDGGKRTTVNETFRNRRGVKCQADHWWWLIHVGVSILMFPVSWGKLYPRATHGLSNGPQMASTKEN